MQAEIPTTLVDRTYDPFPPGTYKGEISGAEITTFDSGDANLRLSVQNIQPLGEDTPDPDGRPFNGDIAVRRDGVGITEIADFSDRDLNFGLRLGAGLLAGVAEAVGAGERGETSVSTDLSAVIDALTSGEWEGAEIGFEVQNRTYEDRNGKEQTTDDFRRIGAAS